MERRNSDDLSFQNLQADSVNSHLSWFRQFKSAGEDNTDYGQQQQIDRGECVFKKRAKEYPTMQQIGILQVGTTPHTPSQVFDQASIGIPTHNSIVVRGNVVIDLRVNIIS